MIKRRKMRLNGEWRLLAIIESKGVLTSKVYDLMFIDNFITDLVIND